MKDNEAGFIQSGHGASATFTEVRKEITSFSDFGVKYDGSQDDYAAAISCIEYARDNRIFIALPFGSGYLRVFPTAGSESESEKQ